VSSVAVGTFGEQTYLLGFEGSLRRGVGKKGRKRERERIGERENRREGWCQEEFMRGEPVGEKNNLKIGQKYSQNRAKVQVRRGAEGQTLTW